MFWIHCLHLCIQCNLQPPFIRLIFQVAIPLLTSFIPQTNGIKPIKYFLEFWKWRHFRNQPAQIYF